jgi:predicted short-subunit dehydrogenase-like oxidoreductase (DUF2520 family)
VVKGNKKKKIRTIVVLGSGNVATHLSLAFYRVGFKILQVYSRNLENARELAKIINTDFTSDLNSIVDDADLYLFALSDSAIQPVLENKKWPNKILIHTAGSVSIEIFKPFTEKFGVIYPLQSFSKNRKIDISLVPFLIEASAPEIANILESFIQKISNNIYSISFREREILHLAAVFANNFTNHLYSISDEILRKYHIPFSYLQPLIEETILKAIELGPKAAQTGPAVRNNLDVLQKHLNLLRGEPEWQNLYKFISDNIIKYHKN